MFVHNHPSGNPKPSTSDNVLKLNSIEVCDHFIIVDIEFILFNEKSLLQALLYSLISKSSKISADKLLFISLGKLGFNCFANVVNSDTCCKNTSGCLIFSD